MEVANTSPFDFTPGFGRVPEGLGTIERTDVITKIERIHQSDRFLIGLSAYQMYNMRDQFGQFWIKNLLTKKKLKVEVYNAWGSMSCKDDRTIAINEKVKETLELQNGSWVQITRKLDERGRIKYNCELDQNNPFGQTWDKHAYTALAVLTDIASDIVEGRFEINLSDMQISYLMINKHLRPLCGEEEFNQLKQISPKAQGILKLQFEEKVFEVDVFNFHENQSGAALTISASLAAELKAKIGDKVMLSSRFDQDSLQKAVECQTPPTLSGCTILPHNYLDVIRSSSLDQLQKRFSQPQDSNWLNSASCLEYLTNHIEEVLKDPPLLSKAIESFCLHVIYSIEYERLIDAIKLYPHKIEEKIDTYFAIFEEELKLAPDNNPRILDAFIKMGFGNIQNSQGEAILHLLFKLGKGKVGPWIKDPKLNVNLKTKAGQTPLHYACLHGHSSSIIYIAGFKDRIIELNIQDNEGRTPLHLACLRLNNSLDFEALIILKNLIEMFPKSLESVDLIDKDEKKPFDYFPNKLKEILRGPDFAEDILPFQTYL